MNVVTDFLCSKAETDFNIPAPCELELASSASTTGLFGAAIAKAAARAKKARTMRVLLAIVVVRVVIRRRFGKVFGFDGSS